MSGMRQTLLGSTGIPVSRICLGSMSFGSPNWRDWVLDEKTALPVIERAVEAGINFFDTADVYSQGRSEEVLGRALRALGLPREKMVIATKVGLPVGDEPHRSGLSRKHILESIDASLQRLGFEYVDLYQIHRLDSVTPIEVTLEALHHVVESGRALHLGASTMPAWQFALLLGTADRLGLHRFVTMQNHYNLVYREEEREMLPLCRAEGVGVIPWSPLARGFLARGPRPDEVAPTTRAGYDWQLGTWYTRESDHAVWDQVSATARNHGVSAATVALSWLLHQPGVVAPIVGTTSIAHVDDAAAAVDLELDDEALAAMEAPYSPHPAPLPPPPAWPG
jgi:aryl-alcohol dehydrogenase (NADP+)